MSKKKSKKHNKKKNIKKQNHSKFLHDGIIIDVPYDEVIRKDISNAATIVDFYSDYYCTVPGCRDFDDVIKDLCVYINGKGKSYNEIFTYLMDNITYPISAPKPIKSFVFNDIPDIDALTYGITCAFDFGRDYLHSCTETKFECDNYKFVISYNSDSCTVEIICEKLE